MQTPYTVPEIARITGIPETTLYDYVRQFTGIVPEMDPTEENGRARRRYPEQAIAVFQTIRHLKDRGVDLPTIRALLQEGKPASETSGADQTEETVRLIEAATGPSIETLTPDTPIASEPRAIDASPSEGITDAPAALARVSEITLASLEITEVRRDEPTELQRPEAPLSGTPFFEPPNVTEVTSELRVAEVAAVPESSPEAAILVPEPEVAPSIARPDVVALQGQLLGSLDEGLRGLRELLSTQNAENDRLREELQKERETLQQEREENTALRADLANQKDQNRSAERLLALIRNHCEEGIQSISP